MDRLEKQMLCIVNRNHQLRTIMDKIDRELQHVHFANQLSKISARRKK